MPINLLNSICELDLPMHLIIRLHPTCEFRYKVELDLKKWEMKTNNTFEITQGNSLNYDLFRSDMHITHQSALLCEASEIGIRTFCLSNEINFKNLILAQIDTNDVIQLENEKEKIKEKIRYYLPEAKKKDFSKNI